MALRASVAATRARSSGSARLTSVNVAPRLIVSSTRPRGRRTSRRSCDGAEPAVTTVASALAPHRIHVVPPSVGALDAIAGDAPAEAIGSSVGISMTRIQARALLQPTPTAGCVHGDGCRRLRRALAARRGRCGVRERCAVVPDRCCVSFFSCARRLLRFVLLVGARRSFRRALREPRVGRSRRADARGAVA